MCSLPCCSCPQLLPPPSLFPAREELHTLELVLDVLSNASILWGITWFTEAVSAWYTHAHTALFRQLWTLSGAAAHGGAGRRPSQGRLDGAQPALMLGSACTPTQAGLVLHFHLPHRWASRRMG